MWLSVSRVKQKWICVLKKIIVLKKLQPDCLSKTVLCPQVFQQINLARLIAIQNFSEFFGIFTPFRQQVLKKQNTVRVTSYGFDFSIYQNGIFFNNLPPPSLFGICKESIITWLELLIRLYHPWNQKKKSKNCMLQIVPPTHKKIQHNNLAVK